MNAFELIEEAERGTVLDRGEIAALLSAREAGVREALLAAAYRVKTAEVGPRVFLRGIIEFSNVCSRDCYYCGIRRSNPAPERFRMAAEEILAAARRADGNGYGSIVLQSGEVRSGEFTEFVEKLLLRIKEVSGGRLGITLSLGEQDAGTCRRWFAAGAHRYLLRIETSDPELYRTLHPPDHRFENRVECLKLLRRGGWQVGTGVMIGLPGQTPESLAADLLFFRDLDIDMLGMGPYIPHSATPLAAEFGEWNSAARRRQLELGLRMIALARLVLRDVNIAATTALQTLDPRGRELGLSAGANVIMPNITPTRYRTAYQLYDGKPCLDETGAAGWSGLEERVKSLGETIGFGQWGDSPHFRRRTAPPAPRGGEVS